MDHYLIEGGHPVSGTIRASGNKNAALPCLAAALLTDEPVILRNIPDIEDVQVMLEVYRSLGGKVEVLSPNTYRLLLTDLTGSGVPREYAQKVRASILFAGPLLARTGKAVLPPPRRRRYRPPPPRHPLSGADRTGSGGKHQRRIHLYRRIPQGGGHFFG